MPTIEHGQVEAWDSALGQYVPAWVGSLPAGPGSGYEPAITPGTTSQYWRGDKSWQALNKAAVGLGNVDNTSDAGKPVSTAQQAALNLKAPLASPALTGTPTAPTATPGTNTTQISTTAFVRAEIAALVNGSPAALDTLNEFAAALGNDPNFATTNATALGNRLRVDTNAQGLTSTQQGNGRTNLGLGTAAVLNVPVSGNAAAGEVVKGSDTRLTDARTPTAHAASHAVAGSDPLTLSQSQITNLTTDLAAKQPLDATLTAFAGLSITANVLPYGSGADVFSTTPLTAFARTLLDDANQAAMQTTLALVPGTNVQAYDAELAAIAGLTGAADKGVYFTGPGAAALYDLSSFARTLLDDTTQGAAKTTLGLGTGDSPQFAGATFTGDVLLSAATANLFLKDTSTGFKSASSTVITPQANNAVRSTSFTSGLVGWNVSAAGDAEFNNIRARGEIASSVFKVSEVTATAGTLGVFYSASTLTADATTPASVSSSFTFNAKNSDAGGMLFAVGDVVRLKSWTGAAVSDSWATITGRTNNTTYTAYTATLNSGSTSATFRAGMAVIDYGPSGSGNITLSTDGTVGASPNLSMATHSGSPWSAQTTLLRLGNLNGAYGYASDVYGFGAGQYGAASKAWTTVDQTSGYRIGVNTTTLWQVDTSANMTLGQVANNVGNAYWNNSNKRLEFRGGSGGTVVQAYIGTDGSLRAANDKVSIDLNGIQVTGTGQGYRFVDSFSGGATIGALTTHYDASNVQIDLEANGGSSRSPVLNIISTSSTGGLIQMTAVGGAATAYMLMSSGTSGAHIATTSVTRLSVGDAAYPAHMLHVAGAANVTGNLTVDTNTLYVDATANRVGVGTTTLATAFNVTSADTYQALYLASGTSDGTTAGFALKTSAVSPWEIRFQTKQNRGWFEMASSAGTVFRRWEANDDLLASTGLLGWSSETNYATAGVGARDVAIGRNAAGVIEVNNGTLGTFRDLIVRALRSTSNSIRLDTARTPASAGATGTTGEICWDANFLYVCVSTNTWKRAALSTW